ncbi:MAG: NAD(P)/FAD-dependent oxidoreductase [Oscillospiraceae bacterium]|nr:NAD(P)/FAD-dependent oxidoreductase [Oscillospiraceae bacterium]
MEQTDALVVGFGPAGSSAALYLCRAGLRVTLVGKDYGALARAERIENYFGLPQPLSGKELAETGCRQAEALGASVLRDEVLAVGYEDRFVAALASGRELAASAVLLATGSSKAAPPIPGLAALEGKGVSFCAVCDGFLYRGRPVAVLGSWRYALHEMEELLPLAGSVALLTNGEELTFPAPDGVAVYTQPIGKLIGEEKLEGARLSDGTELSLAGLFVALGSASANDLARKLGAPLQGNAIRVDAEQRTVLPGLFAAGDCTGGMAQISLAAAEGAKAALAMIQYLRNLRKK